MIAHQCRLWACRLQEETAAARHLQKQMGSFESDVVDVAKCKATPRT